MKKKIKKSRVFWLKREWLGYIELCGLNHRPMRGFCTDTFFRYYPIDIEVGQKKKVKITIEVLE